MRHGERVGGTLGLREFLWLVTALAAIGILLALVIHNQSTAALPRNAGAHASATFDGAQLSPVSFAPPLALRNYLGDPVNIAAYRGDAVFVTFLYVNCPDVCPLITASLHDTVLKLPPPELARVRIVAVSVDPRGDTPSSVAAFLKVHGMISKMKYLIGSPSQLAPVWKAWNVGSARDSATPQYVSHSALVYGIAASGKLETIYPANFSPGQIVHDVPLLLAT